ncbi:MAG TPA: peptide ABC transporter ATP-binding protein [Eubacteriaceae bacterium]|nr:peptide ABC transporter ATP-binding protein [Eubacteriaceae bacterium]
MSEIVMELKNVGKTYENGGKNEKAVKDVSLTFYRGEIFGLVGESGCGKSTLAKLITCFERPDQGEVLFKQKNITSITRKAVRDYRKNVQMIFQNPDSSIPPRMKIGRFVQEPLLNYQLCTKDEAGQKMVRLLEAVGLKEHFMNRYPRQMSGGEKQRACIARVLGMNPEMIVFDEATSALDVFVQKQVGELLKELHAKSGGTYILIGHDLAFIQQMCSRIAVMYQGEIVEILESANLKNARHPYTKLLLDSVFNVKNNKVNFGL